MTDAVTADLNPDPDEAAVTGSPAAALERPADSAPKSAWADYCVSLGVARDAVEGSSRHWSDAAGRYVDADGYTKDELIDLAGRLGG
jgi:hypothetical protein